MTVCILACDIWPVDAIRVYGGSHYTLLTGVQIPGGGGGRLPETLYHRDDALRYIAYVMLIWAAPIQRPYHRDDALLYITYVLLILAAPIPADRWHCSLWP